MKFAFLIRYERGCRIRTRSARSAAYDFRNESPRSRARSSGAAACLAVFISRAICESSEAVPRTYNSCHNVTRDQMESGATYVSLMTENLDVIREALGERAYK